VDAISFDRKLSEVKAGQIIIADEAIKVRETEGIYRVGLDRKSIFEAALRAVINRGKIVKPLAVEADLANCAAGKSGLVGCTLCESACIHGAVARDGDRISYSLGSCRGCGACAAVCPVSIPIFKIAPRKVIHQQIKNLLRARVEQKVILFTCERRGELLAVDLKATRVFTYVSSEPLSPGKTVTARVVRDKDNIYLAR
jgi:Fe-S-cluster-containing hydrogenase component 2